MHNRLADLGTGETLGPLVVPVSDTASARYWRAAGIDPPPAAEGCLFPPMAANLTILLFQTAVVEPVLHTAQRLTCHRLARAGVELTVDGRIAERYERRGREYAVVDAVVRLPDGAPLWSSHATFTPVAA
jgi:hypothetical protein